MENPVSLVIVSAISSHSFSGFEGRGFPPFANMREGWGMASYLEVRKCRWLQLGLQSEHE
jgi:hypothetical protein